MSFYFLRSLFYSILFVTFVCGQPVQAMMSCSEIIEKFKALPQTLTRILSKKEKEVQETIKPDEKSALAEQAINGPVYRDDYLYFDVRLVPGRDGKNEYEPQVVLDDIVFKTTKILSKYKKLGFITDRFIQVLVETGTGIQLETGLLSLVSEPSVVHLGPIYLPTMKEKKIVVDEFSVEPNSGKNYTAIVLPIEKDKSHSKDGEFTLYHEFAHALENKKSFKSNLWREARADILAFLGSGKYQLLYPKITIVNNIIESRIVLDRDLKNPEITKKKELLPDLSEYHYNSQIISATLFSMIKVVNEKFVIDFIKFMDSIVVYSPDMLPKIVERKDLERNQVELKNNTLWVSFDMSEALSSTIISREIRQIGFLMQKYLKSKIEIDHSTKDGLRTLIRENLLE